MIIHAFILKAIASSIIGDASSEWFKKTKVGIWFYAKVEQVYNWAAKRYDIQIATTEEKLLKKYPALMKRINTIEAKISELEK